MCITGLERSQPVQVHKPIQLIVQGVQSPDVMEQIVRQRLQEQQMNRFQ